MKIILKNLTIPFINLISFYYLISCGLRLTLWIIYGIAGNVSIINIPQILIFGIIQDSIALIFLLLPLSIMQILPDKILYSKFSENILMITSYALLFGVLFLFPTEILFFDEFNARFNLVAVDYFAYPTEVFGNIWESYPIIWFVILFLAVSYFIWRLFWPRFSQFYANQRSWKYRFSQLFIHVIICALYLKFGSIDLFANNTNRVQSQITHNGILTFAEAFYTNSIDFNQYYTLLDNDNANKIMRKILAEKGGEFISNQSGNFQRHFNSKPDALGKMNVVIIGEESLGAQYIGALGDNRNLTPNFDALSKKGLLFENAFATGTRTVRGLEAISMSFPPIPSESTVRRAGNEGMANLAEVLNKYGYNSSFLYGGYGAFDNMNYFFGNNGYQISDRLDVEKVTFSNIWGICDEDLFTHAIDYFDQKTQTGQPFFSLLMTTSNHKPFTFRPGLDGIPESGGGRDMGVKYADFALGQFFKDAKTKSWYKNTIFVVVGDHDSRVYGRAYIPVERFRVALMILAPGHITPKHIKNVTSHIDILPTIMGLLGLEYQGPFYGRDILDPAAPMNQAVLINHNHDVGMYKDGILSVTSLNQQIRTFKYTKDNKTIEIEPDIKMQNQLTAYLQTAYKQFKDKEFKIMK